MNLVQFLKEIDTSVVEMSRKQLEVFITNLLEQYQKIIEINL